MPERQMAEEMMNHRFDAATAAAAGEKARETLAARRALRERIAAGGLDAAGAFEAALGDGRTASMPVRQVVSSFPGIGKATTDAILGEAGVGAKRRVKQLGSRQVAALADLIEASRRKPRPSR